MANRSFADNDNGIDNLMTVPKCKLDEMLSSQVGSLSLSLLVTVLLLVFGVYVYMLDIEKDKLWNEAYIVVSSQSQPYKHVHELSEAQAPSSASTISKYLPRHAFNCSAVIGGDIFEIRRAERFLGLVKFDRSSPNKKRTGTSHLTQSSSTCESLSSELNRYPASSADSNYPLAFTVLVYQNPDQLHRLLRSIYRSWNYYCIHVDSKASGELVAYVQSLAVCLPNIMLATRSYKVKWGSMSVLSAALQCFTDIREQNGHWQYLINIAATDFPLMTNLQLVEYLKSRHGASDVETIPRKDAWRYSYSFTSGDKSLNQFLTCQKRKSKLKKLGRPDYKQIDCGTFTKKSKPPMELTMHKGSFSAMLSKHFVDFLLDSKEAGALLTWLADTFIPDEYFWPTLYHSKYKVQHNLSIYDNFNTRYTHWATMKPNCGGYYEHGLCVFGVADLRWLVGTDAVFAHKFDMRMQPVAVYCLEQRYALLVTQEYEHSTN